jgi:hypothetical protein
MTKAPFQAHFLTLLGPKKPGQVTQRAKTESVWSEKWGRSRSRACGQTAKSTAINFLIIAQELNIVADCNKIKASRATPITTLEASQQSHLTSKYEHR